MIQSSLTSLPELKDRLLHSLDEQLFFSALSQYFSKEFNLSRMQAFVLGEPGETYLVADTKNKKLVGGLKTQETSLIGYVRRIKKAYFSNNAQKDPLCQSEAVAELCLPLVDKGKVWAVFMLQSFSPVRNFSGADIELMKEALQVLEAPLKNMGLFVAAKNLNAALLRKIEEQNQEVATPRFKLQEVTLLGRSMAFQNMAHQLVKVAATSQPLLLQGESGTGKELAARKVHTLSERSQYPYKVLNCSALDERMLEECLFGAVEDRVSSESRVGLLEELNKGTLFLDDVHTLSLTLQAKLKHFIEEKEAYRRGGAFPYSVDVRIIVATDKNLKQMVEQGEFREDLYYKLSIFMVNVPSLRERKEDIAFLAEHYLNKGYDGLQRRTLSQEAQDYLTSYSWPGNIRELRNTMERAFIMNEGHYVGVEDLPEFMLQEKAPVEEEAFTEMTLQELEKKHIIKALDYANGNKTKTARILGITVKTLYNKLTNYGMH